MDRRQRLTIVACGLLLAFLVSRPVPAAEERGAFPSPALIERLQNSPSTGRARIAIIIDDLGNTWGNGVRAILLPGAVAYSILPFTQFSTRLADLAHSREKEVLLHMPMEPEGHQPESPGTLRRDMTREQFALTLNAGLTAVPHVIGINNHMGSLLTQQPQAMTWLMEELKRDGRLFFVDSRTSPSSVADRFARLHGLAHLPRNVFLDHDRNAESIEQRFDELIARAKRRGFALGIGHPHAETLAILERRLTDIDALGVELVPLSQAVHPTQNKMAAAGGSDGEDPISNYDVPIFARGQPSPQPAP